jgi:hypothetical protein
MEYHGTSKIAIVGNKFERGIEIPTILDYASICETNGKVHQRFRFNDKKNFIECTWVITDI